MSTDFEKFTRAVEARNRSDSSTNSSPDFSRVTVLGGGPDARQLAALCLSQNLSVTLFSAYGVELNALRSAGGITLRGESPIGTFQLDQEAVPSIVTTAELDSAVASADLIFLTGPVHKHRTYAMVLADHLRDGQTLVVAPARSFAAFETRWLLQVGGCEADITIVEVQSLPYWARADGSTLHLTGCADTTAGTIPGSHSNYANALRNIMPNLHSAPTAVHSGFSDASGAVEVIALLMGEAPIAEKPDLPDGAVPLEERRTFHSLLDSANSHAVLAAALEERRQVARRFGVRNLPADSIWINSFAGSEFGSGSRVVPSPSEAKAIVRCAVTGSLVPLQSAGCIAGVETPVTDSLITLASTALGRELATAGRRLEVMGIGATDKDEARRRMEAIAKGER